MGRKLKVRGPWNKCMERLKPQTALGSSGPVWHRIRIGFPAMPIYDFACADCGAEFEELVRSDTRVRCPLH
ncbi:MAG: zinc ribbon domain-containing protein [Gemmatimonadales bacterium]